MNNESKLYMIKMSLDRIKGSAGEITTDIRPQSEVADKDAENKAADAAKKEEERIKFEEAEKRMRDFFEGGQRIFERFAGAKIRVKLGKGFSFNMVSKEITLDPRWFIEKGYTEEHVLWVVLHELSHYRDHLESPKDMLEYNLDYSIEKGREYADRYLEKIKEAFGEDDPRVESVQKERPIGKSKTRKMRTIDSYGQKAFNIFFNIFDDVYVNNEVARRADRFDKDHGSGKNEIVRLYREKSFKSTDYTKDPRHMQLLYALLRRNMVPDEDVTVGDEVRAILDDPEYIHWNNETYSIQDFTDEYFKGDSGSIPLKDRYLAMRYSGLQEVFEELYKKDIEDWKPEEEPEGGEGGDEGGGGEGGDGEGGNGEGGEEGDDEGDGGSSSGGLPGPFKKSYDKYDENSPDQGDLQDIDRIVDILEGAQEEAERAEAEEAERKRQSGMTPKEKMEEAERRADQERAEAANIPEQAIRYVREIQEDLEKQIQALSEFWQNILYTARTPRARRKMRGRHQKGTGLNIQALIEEYPQIRKGNLDVRVWKKLEQARKNISFPEQINVGLIGDISGSMSIGSRMEVLHKSIVLLVTSLNEFHTRIKRARNSRKHAEYGDITKTKIDTEVWSYESKTEKVKPFRSEDPTDEITKLAKALTKFTPRGGNDEETAFRTVRESIEATGQKYLKKVKSGDVLDIRFMITDGGAPTSEIENIKQEVQKLKEMGVVVCALQIGTDLDDVGEISTFNAIYNEDGDTLGVMVGDDLERLPEILAESLLDIILKSIKIS